MWALRDQAQDFKFAVAEFGRGERRATGRLLEKNFRAQSRRLQMSQAEGTKEERLLEIPKGALFRRNTKTS